MRTPPPPKHQRTLVAPDQVVLEPSSMNENAPSTTKEENKDWYRYLIEDPHQSDASLVDATLIVYQVILAIPTQPGLISRPAYRPTAELHVMSSSERLIAEFRGDAWPVANGSTVHLKAGTPGAIVYDERGTHALGPGRLASWFSGRFTSEETRTSAMIVLPREKDQGGTTHLLCDLIAEWSNHPRSRFSPRCKVAGPHPQFRLGRWRATRSVATRQEIARKELSMSHSPIYKPHYADTPTVFRSELDDQSTPNFEHSIYNQRAESVLMLTSGRPHFWLRPQQRLMPAPCIRSQAMVSNAFGTILSRQRVHYDPSNRCVALVDSAQNVIQESE